MIQRDQRKRAKPPENKSVRDPRQRPLANHFALQQNLRDKVPHPFADGPQLEIRIRLSLADLAHHSAEAHSEPASRRGQQHQKHNNFERGETRHLLKSSMRIPADVKI